MRCRLSVSVGSLWGFDPAVTTIGGGGGSRTARRTMLFLVTHHVTGHSDQVTPHSGSIGSCTKRESDEAKNTPMASRWCHVAQRSVRNPPELSDPPATNNSTAVTF